MLKATNFKLIFFSAADLYLMIGKIMRRGIPYIVHRYRWASNVYSIDCYQNEKTKYLTYLDASNQ